MILAADGRRTWRQCSDWPLQVEDSSVKKTERIWYYDLNHVRAGKKTPLTLAHFGFYKDGKPLSANEGAFVGSEEHALVETDGAGFLPS
jgi:hypothetical protein